MKKLGIGCLSILGILVILGIIGFVMNNESLPEGQTGTEAEALAQKMVDRININAWDTLNYASWSFMDEHHYIWNKKNNDAVISWADNKVVMDLDEVAGKVMVGGAEVQDAEQKAKLISKAWGYWCNDSFWFGAPYKVFDKGTQRSVVKTDEGKDALMISYTGGGVTPGDSYMWLLDETGMPYAYKMWVKILPLGGIKAQWTDWLTLPGGAMVAQNHSIAGMMNVKITNIKAGDSISDLGLTTDPFQ